MVDLFTKYVRITSSKKKTVISIEYTEDYKWKKFIGYQYSVCYYS